MKLPIKKEYFDKIKSGEKTTEDRDAHLTLVCEETGEKITLGIHNLELIAKENYRGKEIVKNAPGCFDPEEPYILRFWLYKLEGS